MKVRFVLGVSCLMLMLFQRLPVHGQNLDPSLKVVAMEKQWAEAYRQRYISILSWLLADDFIITVEDGNTYSKSGYIAHSGDPSVQVEIAEFSDLSVRLHGNTAVVTGAYHERGKSKGKSYDYRDRLTDVWMNKGGKWQVIASHYSIPTK